MKDYDWIIISKGREYSTLRIFSYCFFIDLFQIY